jgi:hypothetical protein
VAIFADSAATQTTSVGNSATEIFNTSATGIPTGVTLHDVTIVNTGSVTVYLGISAVTASTGLPLQPGAQITYNGYSFAQGASGGNIYAITSSGTAVVVAGLATVNSNV